MKKFRLVLAMLALALALGLAFVSCDDGTTSGGNNPGGNTPGNNNVSPFEGTWIESSSGMQLIITGNTYLLKQDGVNLKRCSFTYTQTTLTETVLDNYGNSFFSIGEVTTVNYTLVGNVLTITTMNQVWNKVN